MLPRKRAPPVPPAPMRRGPRAVRSLPVAGVLRDLDAAHEQADRAAVVGRGQVGPGARLQRRGRPGDVGGRAGVDDGLGPAAGRAEGVGDPAAALLHQDGPRAAAAESGRTQASSVTGWSGLSEASSGTIAAAVGRPGAGRVRSDRRRCVGRWWRRCSRCRRRRPPGRPCPRRSRRPRRGPGALRGPAGEAAAPAMPAAAARPQRARIVILAWGGRIRGWDRSDPSGGEEAVAPVGASCRCGPERPAPPLIDPLLAELDGIPIPTGGGIGPNRS